MEFMFLDTVILGLFGNLYVALSVPGMIRFSWKREESVVSRVVEILMAE